jgi:hypothetical protein
MTAPSGTQNPCRSTSSTWPNAQRGKGLEIPAGCRRCAQRGDKLARFFARLAGRERIPIGVLYPTGAPADLQNA